MTEISAFQGDIAFQANLYHDPNPTRRGLHAARYDWVKSAIVEFLPTRGSAIEVGIGCGIFTNLLSNLGATVTAVDINPAFVNGVRDVPGVTAILADATSDMRLGQHDVALCSEVLEHVPTASSQGMLCALAASLSPSGVLIFTTPQSLSVVELFARLLQFSPVLALAKRLYGHADELGHSNLLTAPALKRQFAMAGLTIEREDRFGFYMPFLAEFGGARGQRILSSIGQGLSKLPLLRGLLWTQAYILRKK